jgi:5-formyltetrahydrofolate cyclo-ligase
LSAIDPLAAEKAALRTRLKAARDALSAADRADFSTAITTRLLALAPMHRARRVFVFISNGSEVETHGLVQTLLGEGREVAVPKIVGKTQMIACRLPAWSGLKPAQLGILTPEVTDPVEAHFDVVVTPGVGFTEAGHRIGYGAGYYDRWFASHSVGHRIAIAFEVQLVPTLPTDEHDLPVDAIVTERRLISLRDDVNED